MPLKGSSDSNHFIFEINVGKKRIRYNNDSEIKFELIVRLEVYWRCRHRKLESVYVGSVFSDIDFLNLMAWVWFIPYELNFTLE